MYNLVWCRTINRREVVSVMCTLSIVSVLCTLSINVAGNDFIAMPLHPLIPLACKETLCFGGAVWMP